MIAGGGVMRSFRSLGDLRHHLLFDDAGKGERGLNRMQTFGANT